MNQKSSGVQPVLRLPSKVTKAVDAAGAVGVAVGAVVVGGGPIQDQGAAVGTAVGIAVGAAFGAATGVATGAAFGAATGVATGAGLGAVVGQAF